MNQNWIVCGWYTPDYLHWWNRLRDELDSISAPHDFVERDKTVGGWEINTMRKPREILAAIDRHPDKTIIFLDVDCTVPGGKADLDKLANISGDIGFYLRTRWRRSGVPRTSPRTGTMVFRPTQKARSFAAAWCAASANAPRYSVDQESMPVVLGVVPGISVTYLDVRFCALRADNCETPVILHDRSRKKRRLRSLTKLIGRLTWRRPQEAGSPAPSARVLI